MSDALIGWLVLAVPLVLGFAAFWRGRHDSEIRGGALRLLVALAGVCTIAVIVGLIPRLDRGGAPLKILTIAIIINGCVAAYAAYRKQIMSLGTLMYILIPSLVLVFYLVRD